MDTMTKKQIEISTDIHNQIPHDIFAIVNGHIYTNAEIKAQHNLEVLDDIIEDLMGLRETLPHLDDIKQAI